PHLGRDGLRPAGGDRGRARPSGPGGRRGRRRWRLRHDDGGARDRGPREGQGRRDRLRQRALRHDPDAPGPAGRGRRGRVEHRDRPGAGGLHGDRPGRRRPRDARRDRRRVRAGASPGARRGPANGSSARPRPALGEPGPDSVVTVGPGADPTGPPADADKPASRGPEPSYPALLSVPWLPRILTSMILARISQSMVSIALVLFTLTEYHSPSLAGAVTLASILPGLLVSPIAGALLDRHGRMRLIVLDYTVAMASMALIAVLSIAGVLEPWLLLLIAIVSSLTSILSVTGIRSLFPIIVPKSLWERANALDSNGYVVATIV